MSQNNETYANATSDSESIYTYGTILSDHYMHELCEPYYNALNRGEFVHGITFRPCENKVVTLDGKRKQYKAYSIEEQKKILLNTVNYWNALAGLIFEDINFEQTKVQGVDLVHFHCFLVCKEKASRFTLLEAEGRINKLYGPKTYKAFQTDLLDTKQMIFHWMKYIMKDIKHPINVWCCGI